MNAPSSPLGAASRCFSRNVCAEQRRLLANFLYDWRRFARHSFVFGARRRKASGPRCCTFWRIRSSTAMSLPAPRPGFGHEKAAVASDQGREL